MRFVERHNRSGNEVVILRYAAVFYWLMWPTLMLTVLAGVAPSVASMIAATAAWVLLLAFAVPYWPIVVELKRRMREESIVASGSKYSFSNPLTYQWPHAKE